MDQAGYTAFITYSHRDAREAARLQKALETWRVPKSLYATHPAKFPKRRLGRVFRDREELSAGTDLSRSISSALKAARHLVVVCSPEAARSRWVNLEISEYRQTHGDDSIFCYVVAGDPSATAGPDSCFPPALFSGHETNPASFEPVAADARQGADGRKLAFLKLVSGLCSIGLDEIVRRDTQRRYRNLMWLSSASMAGMLVMSLLTVEAIRARSDAQQRREEAEDLIEFMLTDLRSRLDEVGRLDVLEVVGDKAVDYYSSVPIKAYSDSSLGRRARAFHLLGEVDDTRGDIAAAREKFQKAYDTTEELLARNPDDGEQIFNHAQSVFWLGYLDWRLENLGGAEQAFRQYRELADQLALQAGDRLDWKAEAGHANMNLGVYYIDRDIREPEMAMEYFQSALQLYESLLDEESGEDEWVWYVAEAYAYISDTSVELYDLEDAISWRQKQIDLFESLLDENPDNHYVTQDLQTACIRLGRFLWMSGDLSESRRQLLRATSLSKQLLALDPENTQTEFQHIQALELLARLDIASGQEERAADYLHEAQTRNQSLLLVNSEDMFWQDSMVQIQTSQALLAASEGRIDDANILLGDVLDLVDSMIEDGRSSMQISGVQARALLLLGKNAKHEFEAANIQDMATLIDVLRSGDANLSLNDLAMLGMAYQMSGRVDEAEEILGTLLTSGYKNPEFLFFDGKDYQWDMDWKATLNSGGI